MAGFCSTGWGLREYVIGRCNFDSHSYEAEACGILQNALSAGVNEQGQPLILGCDNISSLCTFFKILTTDIPDSHIALMSAPPIWLTTKHVVKKSRVCAYIQGRHIKAHTCAEDIQPGSDTYLQDECDFRANESRCLAQIRPEFYVATLAQAFFALAICLLQLSAICR